jgi:hypothetical protein
MAVGGVHRPTVSRPFRALALNPSAYAGDLVGIGNSDIYVFQEVRLEMEDKPSKFRDVDNGELFALGNEILVCGSHWGDSRDDIFSMSGLYTSMVIDDEQIVQLVKIIVAEPLLVYTPIRS